MQLTPVVFGQLSYFFPWARVHQDGCVDIMFQLCLRNMLLLQKHTNIGGLIIYIVMLLSVIIHQKPFY